MSIKQIHNNKSNLENIRNANTSNPHSFSHMAEPNNTSFILQEITLEDLDKMVLDFFDNYFIINGKNIRLINGMVDFSMAPILYPELFNKEKETFIRPLLIFRRSSTLPRGQAKSTYKPGVFTIPTKTPNGIVYEQYKVTPATEYFLNYEFVFISTYKQTTNEIIEQFREYFRNKRNMINFNNEKFTIRPTSGIQELYSEEETNNINESKEYITTFYITVDGYTRNKDSVQKIKLPNTYTLDIIVKDSNNEYNQPIISRHEIKNTKALQ